MVPQAAESPKAVVPIADKVAKGDVAGEGEAKGEDKQEDADKEKSKDEASEKNEGEGQAIGQEKQNGEKTKEHGEQGVVGKHTAEREEPVVSAKSSAHGAASPRQALARFIASLSIRANEAKPKDIHESRARLGNAPPCGSFRDLILLDDVGELINKLLFADRPADIKAVLVAWLC